MKIAGIIGGIGPGSTIEYYRLAVALYRERTRDGSYPPLLINSIDLTRMLDLIARNQLKEVTGYLGAEVERLARAGADFAALASNTPHVVFEALRLASPIPLLSIVEATRDAAKAQGLARLGLFGTRFTMQGRFYPDVLAAAGISVVLPSLEEQVYIHEKYLSELVNGVFLPETRSRLFAIAKRMKSDDGIDGLILGGTELPLILREAPQGMRVCFLDTASIHVERIVTELLS